MKKSLVAGLSLVTLLSTASVASAYRGDPSVQGPNYSPERHAEMTASFAAGENGYTNWLKLMENKAWRLKSVITNAKIFGEFATAHQNGVEAISAFRAKYNLGIAGQGMRDGSGFGRNR